MKNISFKQIIILLVIFFFFFGDFFHFKKKITSAFTSLNNFIAKKNRKKGT